MSELAGRVLFVDVAVDAFLLRHGLLVFARHAIALVVHDAIRISLLRAIVISGAPVV